MPEIAKNEHYTIQIESYTHDGDGVGRIGGMAVFVPYSVVGDVLTVRIVKTAKHYAYAKIIQILTPSPARTSPPCPVFGRCGGCSLMHMSYEEQLAFKRRAVEDAMRKIGGFDEITVLPVLGADKPTRYRNKAQYPVGLQDGRVVAGFYAPRSHEIIPAERCLLQHEASERAVQCVKAWMEQYRVAPYDEAQRTGAIRHIYTRVSFQDGGIMVVLVSAVRRLPATEALVTMLTEQVGGIVGVVLNINDANTNVVLGRENITLYGHDRMTDSIGGVKFLISPQSFYQVNPAQTEVLYNAALTMARLSKADVLLDVYCGIGTISLFAAPHCKAVHGVEIVPEAVEDARKNAELNGTDNAFFHCGDAAEVTASLRSQGVIPDVVVVDPPRKGCDAQMLDLLAEQNPRSIVYISCNPSTLARDLRLLYAKGYTPGPVQPVDMFPNTWHVECVVLMSRVI